MMKKRSIILLFLLIIVLHVFLYVRYKAPGRTHPDERLITDFTQHYYSLGVHYRTTWLGIPTLENPCDMWAIQEIICETRPDFIIETGTYKGGGALFFASVLQNIGETGKVVTIDIKPRIEDAAQIKLFKDRVEFIEGGSTSEQVICRIKERVGGQKVMVTLDLDHHFDHVLDELRLYSKLVSPGCYLIVQDTAHNGRLLPKTFGKGPEAAVEVFLKENRNFQRDKGREKFMLTFHPGGYLKRIK